MINIYVLAETLYNKLIIISEAEWKIKMVKAFFFCNLAWNNSYIFSDESWE